MAGAFAGDLGPERISCFLIGSIQAVICPLPGFFTEDPLFYYETDPHQAGLSLEQRIRHDRLYFPRTKQRLLDKFDMVFFADPYIDHFTPRQFGDLYSAFTEEGMPSYWSFGPAYGGVIQTTILSDMLPISDYQGYYHRSWRAVFREGQDPVFTPFVELGVENVLGEAYAWMRPRQETVVWADMEPLDLPWIVSWRPGLGGGIAWVYADEFNLQWWGLAAGSRGSNPFALEMVANMILYSLGRSLIIDVHSRREARNRISNYRTQKLVVLSMLDWADKFGANTFALSEELRQLDESIEEALDQYILEEYALSMATTEQAFDSLAALTGRALRLKDQALLWVFLLEWMAVTSTALLAGVILWTLMVRRRSYRPVGVTRIAY